VYLQGRLHLVIGLTYIHTYIHTYTSSQIFSPVSAAENNRWRWGADRLTNWLMVGCNQPVSIALTVAIASKAPAAAKQCPIIDWRTRKIM